MNADGGARLKLAIHNAVGIESMPHNVRGLLKRLIDARGIACIVGEAGVPGISGQTRGASGAIASAIETAAGNSS